jgi:predicted transcriptional regulator
MSQELNRVSVRGLPTSTRLDKETKARLDALAKKYKCSTGAIMRAMITMSLSDTYEVDLHAAIITELG